MAFSFDSLISPLKSDRDIVRYGYAALVVFGILWVGQSFGFSGAFWLAVLVGIGVLINTLGGGFGSYSERIFGV